MCANPSTTFFGLMIGYWILIGLKNMLWGNNNLQFFSPPTFVLQGDILIAYSSHMGKPTLPCCVYSETIKDCNSIALHVFFHLYGRSGRKAIYHSFQDMFITLQSWPVKQGCKRKLLDTVGGI